MEYIFGQTLVSKSKQVQTRTINYTPLVLIYASASWCPPCREFYPVLVEFYNAVNRTSKQIEIIWLSRDRGQEEFESTKKNLPWLAVPFNQSHINELLERYEIDVIPKLFLLNRDGSIAHDGCRQDVVRKGPDALSEWLKIRN